MSIEVAILNRHGVALAADSFEPWVLQNKKKFVSVERIFQLSKDHPVGIILGWSKYINTPWETVIKLYREHIGNKSFDTLKEYAKDFIDFFSNDTRFDAPLIEKLVVEDAIEYCLNKVRQNVAGSEDYEKAISNQIEKELKNLGQNNFISGFDENFIQLYLEKHKKDLENYMRNNTDFNMDMKTLENFMLMSALIICKSNYLYKKYNSGGIAIVGYGESEIFPSIYIYKIIVKIDGKQIYELLGEDCIGVEEGQPKQAVVALDQNDVLSTYIDGINPKLLDSMNNLFDKSINNFLEESQKLHKYSSEDILQINNISSELKKYFRKEFDNFQIDICRVPFLKMITRIGKEEMIVLAEALINLTTMWKKFTANEENMSGPTDVAIITKGSGFQWIKKQ